MGERCRSWDEREKEMSRVNGERGSSENITWILSTASEELCGVRGGGLWSKDSLPQSLLSFSKVKRSSIPLEVSRSSRGETQGD
mmetsp:Transcript_8248/g.16718  ORF Transcript_8248/g.16718 Transcript_8248/m.16718 type:complete len:84 (-) Transcript_8248:1350-1601(-)